MSQPTVIPAAYRTLLTAVWVLPSVSVNPAGAAGSSLRARTRKVAIWARVTDSLGQYWGGLVVQPTVIFWSASSSV